MKKLFPLLAILISSCQQPEPKIHITGSLKNEGFFGNKKHITIEFNGYKVIDGFLDKYNNADLIGQFENNTVKAQCSGADTINCLIQLKGKETIITFNNESKN